jgi:hypothetical protein
MSSTRQGTLGLIQISSGESYDPMTGVSEIIRYKGSHAEAATYLESLRGTGVQATREPIEGTPMSIVSVRIAPTEDESETTWELIPINEELQPWEAPRVKAEVRTLDENALASFDVDVNAVRSGTADESTFSGWDSYPAIQSCLKAIAAGITYRATRAVLKKTRYVSPTSSTRDTGYGTFGTTSELVATQGIPSYLADQLEDGEWLKSFGGSQFSSDGRKVYTVLYEFQPTGGWDWQKELDGTL